MYFHIFSPVLNCDSSFFQFYYSIDLHVEGKRNMKTITSLTLCHRTERVPNLVLIAHDVLHVGLYSEPWQHDYLAKSFLLFSVVAFRCMPQMHLDALGF